MNGVTKICVARHGETDWNVAGKLQGWTDVPLNDNGRRQADELSETLAGFGFSHICTSPLRRAAETAEIIASRLNLAAPTCHEGLKERNFGIVQGRLKEELSASHPRLLLEILRRNPACHFDEGESLDGFSDRVLAALTDIARQNPGARVLVITHGWVMDVVTRHIGNLPRDAILGMKRKNGECVWVGVCRRSTIFEIDCSASEYFA